MKPPPPPRVEIAPEEIEGLRAPDAATREATRRRLATLRLPDHGASLSRYRRAYTLAVVLLATMGGGITATILGVASTLVLVQVLLGSDGTTPPLFMALLGAGACTGVAVASVVGVRAILRGAERRARRSAEDLHHWLMHTAFVVPRVGVDLVNVAGPRRTLDAALARSTALRDELAELRAEAEAAQALLSEAQGLPVGLPGENGGLDADAPRAWLAELSALQRRAERLAERLGLLRDELGPPDPPASTMRALAPELEPLAVLDQKVADCRRRVFPGGRSEAQPVRSSRVDLHRRLEPERR